MSAFPERRRGARLQSVAVERRPASVEELPISCETRLRTHIARRDQLARELFELDHLIAAESRRFADAHGLTVRPTIPQLKRHLRMEAD